MAAERAPSHGYAETQRMLVEALVGGKMGEALPLIVPGGTLSAEGALNVYRNGYFARLTEAMGETYEALWWVLGDERFFQICRQFIEGHRSRWTNLTDYGGEFPAFVEGLRDSAEMPFLGELGRFESMFRELFHSAAPVSLSGEALQAALSAGGDVRLTLCGSMDVRAWTHSVYEIWKLRQVPHDEAPEVRWEKPQRLWLYRAGIEVYVEELTEGELHVLRALKAGQPLSEALAAGSGADQDFGPEQAQTFFSRLFGAGVVVGVEPLSHTSEQGVI